MGTGNLTDSQFWVGRPVLVTGASGFVGRCLSRSLRAAGAAVFCLVRNSCPDPGQAELCHSVHGDIGDRDLLKRTVADYQIQIVFHLAAQPLMGAALDDPLCTLETNIRGTWNLLEACRHSPGIRAVLLASTYQAYGDQGQLVCTEETPLAARDPYGISKFCADMIAETYARSYGLPVAIVRSGNLFGGGDRNSGRIVPSTIESVLRGERPVIRSDGESRRDYLYVEDSAAAFLLLAEKLAGNHDLSGQAFNFSNEDPISVLGLVREILTRMQSSLEPDVRREFSGGNRHQYISSAKARAGLGWRPRFTLGEGLDRTIAWYRDRFPR